VYTCEGRIEPSKTREELLDGSPHCRAAELACGTGLAVPAPLHEVIDAGAATPVGTAVPRSLKLNLHNFLAAKNRSWPPPRIEWQALLE